MDHPSIRNRHRGLAKEVERSPVATRRLALLLPAQAVPLILGTQTRMNSELSQVFASPPSPYRLIRFRSHGCPLSNKGGTRYPVHDRYHVRTRHRGDGCSAEAKNTAMPHCTSCSDSRTSGGRVFGASGEPFGQHPYVNVNLVVALCPQQQRHHQKAWAKPRRRGKGEEKGSCNNDDDGNRLQP